ncbi:MAG: hypothetical protein IPO04_19615, partial [Cytophagaceae bacterium]|nr:hypothetical protein [Cytophagaceae bacterium]
WNQHNSDADRRGALKIHCNERKCKEKLRLLNEQMDEKNSHQQIRLRSACNAQNEANVT